MGLFAKKVPVRQVRIHYRDDAESLDGIYVGTGADHYIIAKPVLIRADGNVNLDGEVWVPRERVLFMQVTR